jgi:hypothetical protein
MAYLDGSTSKTGAQLEIGVLSGGPVVPLKRFSSVAFDGSTDVGPAINAALISLRDAGGGMLGLPASDDPGMLGEPVIVQNKTGLAGAGHYATTLKSANGLDDYAVQNYVSTDDVEANAEFIVLRDFRLDGNKANQTAGGGVYLYASPTGAAATNDLEFDTHPRLFNIMFWNSYQDGFSMGSRSGAILVACATYGCGRNGYRPTYDTELVGCTAGRSGEQGFYIASSSCRLTACKSWWSGQVTAASGQGFIIKTAGAAALAGCEAQDNWDAGFLLENTERGSVLAGCIADSNSRRGIGTAPGFDIWNSSANRISGMAYERNAYSESYRQRNALRIRVGGGTSRYNDISLSHLGVNSAVVDASVTSSSDAVGRENTIRINGGVSEWTTPTFAASFSPWAEEGEFVPLTLTDNLTINSPGGSGRTVGNRLTFLLKQDGTGSRTVTFNSVFKLAGGAFTATTTANRTDVIRFVFDGTNWVELGRNMNVAT